MIKNYINQFRRICAILLCALLSSCGGGGGDSGNSSANPPIPVSTQTCVAPPRPATSITLQSAFPSLTFSDPVLLLQAPGDDSRWFVVERGGRVRIFPNRASVTSVDVTTFIDIDARVESGPGEAGLLGMAFHPQFASNRRVYLSYTRSGSPLVSVISSFVSNDGGLTLDPGSEQQVLTLNQPFDNHNGGNIAFGKDNLLYIGFGDGGSGGDPQGNGQNMNTLLGKMLRIDVDGGSPYAIPSDNPFAGGGGRGEIYASGFRNPWRWSFDMANGELWAGDVGQGNWEEVDKVVRGGNYGWKTREGQHCFSPSTGCSTAGFIDPVAEYSHAGGRCSITGGYVYRGNAIAALQGQYLFGDFCSGEIWSLRNQTGATAQLVARGGSISSFGQGNDGEVYVVTFGGSGQIFRLTQGSATPGSFPSALSTTGCVNPANPTQPAATVVAYDINVPFWSDGATKQRFIALPSANSIHIESNHDWRFPIGTVLMKNFNLGGRLIETRLFMRHSDGEWGGYSYEWNAAQTDATLVLNGKTATVAGQSWRYPSTAECLRCHTTAAGRALGPETAQINLSVGGVNQLTDLHSRGFFDAPLPAAPSALPALPPTNSSASLESRARAYLHSNCSICHQPGGPTPVSMDLRYSTPFASTNICNVTPQEGNLGVSGARIFAPGDAAHSVLALRMRALNSNRMPPLASSVVDNDGATLIETWIASRASCL